MLIANNIVIMQTGMNFNDNTNRISSLKIQPLIINFDKKEVVKKKSNQKSPKSIYSGSDEQTSLSYHQK